MGFRFKRTFGSGPFRATLSKSGISYSIGVKGARVTFSNHGTYVSFGRNGIHYRKKITGPDQHRNYQRVPKNLLPATFEQHTITSTDVEQITDTDSQDFINELTDKGNKISYYNWFGMFPLIIIVFVFPIIFFSRPGEKLIKITEIKDYIKSSNNSNINIRQTPERSSTAIGILTPYDQYELLDSTNADWHKIAFNGKTGYVSKQFTSKMQVSTTRDVNDSPPAENRFKKNRPIFWICLSGLIGLFAILLPYLKKVDKRRLLVEIYYDIDEKVNEVYQKFIYHFSELLNCSRTWQYLHSERTNDYKYSSGAAHAVTRKLLTNISTDKTPSRVFRTNVQIPYLGLINSELYFFPERLIIKRGNQYGAIMYKNINCLGNITQFIESGGVPSDSVVVGHTWRYLNKNGGPDKRFSNNYQIPICRYSEYSFQSTSGLNEKIATSKVDGFNNFISYITAIGQLQRHFSTDTSNEQDTFQKEVN